MAKRGPKPRVKKIDKSQEIPSDAEVTEIEIIGTEDEITKVDKMVNDAFESDEIEDSLKLGEKVEEVLEPTAFCNTELPPLDENLEDATGLDIDALMEKVDNINIEKIKDQYVKYYYLVETQTGDFKGIYIKKEHCDARSTKGDLVTRLKVDFKKVV